MDFPDDAGGWIAVFRVAVPEEAVTILQPVVDRMLERLQSSAGSFGFEPSHNLSLEMLAWGRVLAAVAEATARGDLDWQHL